MDIIHTCYDTGHAYDVCQCREDVRNGDILDIPSEGVIGLAWTWPVAVTAEHGELHSIAKGGDVYGLAADAGWRLDQVRAAVRLAVERKLPLDPAFEVFA